MITFDTDRLPRGQRARAWVETRAEALIPSTVELADPDHFHGRFEHWQLGDFAVSRQTVNSGQRLYRSPDQVRVNGPRKLSISLHESGDGNHEQFGVRRRAAAGRLICTDLTAPWEYSFGDAGSVKALVIDYDALGLPLHVIRTGIQRLETSPVYESVTRRLGTIFDQLTVYSAHEETASSHSGTVTLMRTLLSFSARGVTMESSWRDSHALLTQVKVWLDRHLCYQPLTAPMIASAMMISVDELHRMFIQKQFDWQAWVVDRRLRHVKEDLSFWGAEQDVATVAARWGFGDMDIFHHHYDDKFGAADS